MARGTLTPVAVPGNTRPQRDGPRHGRPGWTLTGSGSPLPASLRLRERVRRVRALRAEHERQLPLRPQAALSGAERGARLAEIQCAQHVLSEVAVLARDASLLRRCHEPLESFPVASP